MTPIERRTAQAMLVAEGASLAALRAAIVAITSGGATKRTLSALFERVLTEAIASTRAGRLTAKQVGSRTMRAELAAVVGRPVVLRTPTLDAVDDERAEQDALALAKGVTVLGERALETSSRITGASFAKGLDGSVRRIAATQTGESFNRERDDAAAEWKRDPENQFIPIILRRWNAMLDACKVCKGLAGQVRPLGFDYENNQQPGRVHKYCRCFSTIIPIPAYITR